jgi:hypothetical protein
LPTPRAQQTLTRESSPLVEVALQRCEGWGGCRTPPFGGPLRSLGVSRRSEDSNPQDQDGYGFPSDPWAFRRPSGGRPADLGLGRSRTRALLALSCPVRDMPLQPRTAASLHRPEGRATRPAMQPLLGFRALRHSLGPADPPDWRRIPPPPRAACEVWIPPSRRPPPVLPARKAPERPWASPSKAFPSAREVPLSGSLPS